MGSLRSYIFLLSLVAVLAGQVFAGSVLKDKSLGASSKNGNITVVWQTVDETNVARFEIWRAQVSTDGELADFTYCGTVNPLGAGREYEYVDAAPFKVSANLFAYKVRVIFRDGTFSDSEIVKTVAIASTAKRTWGSIKAMFR